MGMPPAERAHCCSAGHFRIHPRKSWRRCPGRPRDDQLLQLRQRLFGGTLESIVRCPCCGESLEIKVDAHELKLT
jgi:hypothetical protein